MKLKPQGLSLAQPLPMPCVYNSLTAFLKVNLQTIKITHCKCMVRWFLVNVIELCNRHHNPIPILEHFHWPPKVPSGLFSPSWLLSPGPGKHESTFCLHEFAHPGHFVSMELYGKWSFVIGFLHGASCF